MYTPDKPSPKDLPALEFEVNDKDVAQAKGVLLAQNPDNKSQLALLGLIGMGLIDPGKWELEWDGEFVGVKTGPDELVPATVLPWIIGSKKGEFGAQLVSVAGTLEADGEKLSATVLFDAETGKSTSMIIATGGQPNALPFATVLSYSPKATFTPGVLIVNKDTGEQKLDPADKKIPLTKDGFELAFGTAPAATYYLSLSVMDVWGNEDFESHEIKLSAPIQ